MALLGSKIESYLFGRMLSAMLIVLFGLNGILWIVWATRGDVFFAAGLGPALTFLSLTFLVLPLISASLIPFGLLLGGLQAFSGLNRDAELVILDAAGMPRRKIWRPVLILCVISSVFAGWLSIQLGPASMRAFEQRTQNASADLIYSIFREGEFKSLTKNLTVHIGTLESDSVLGEIFISDERDENVQFIYYASKGAVIKQNGGAYLALSDGEIHRMVREDGSSSIVKFESYAFDFSSLLASARVRGFALNARYISELLFRDLNDPLFQDSDVAVTRELLDRFSAPFYVFTFGLAVLCFAARPNTGRNGGFANGLSVFLLCGVIRALGWGILSFCAVSPYLWPLPFLLPLGFAAFFFYGFLRPHPMKFPNWISAWLLAPLFSALNQFAELAKRALNAARGKARQNAHDINMQRGPFS